MKHQFPSAFAAFALIMLCSNAGDTPVYANNQEPGSTSATETEDKLVDADGVDLVRGRCLICHDSNVIVSQHLSRRQWDQLLDWMEKTQGMAAPSEIERGTLLDYLEQTQAPRPLPEDDSPWATPRYRPNPLWN